MRIDHATHLCKAVGCREVIMRKGMIIFVAHFDTLQNSFQNLTIFFTELSFQNDESKVEESGVSEYTSGFPAHAAAYSGDLARVRFLIETGAVNVNERDDKGCTLLHKGAVIFHKIVFLSLLCSISICFAAALLISL